MDERIISYLVSCTLGSFNKNTYDTDCQGVTCLSVEEIGLDLDPRNMRVGSE
jgi:hypothetical protein